MAYAVGLGIAILGSVAWGAIAIYFDYELGILAWAIGAAIGTGAVAVGGRGFALALVCAVLALVSMLGGRVISLNHALNEEIGTAFDRDLYEEMVGDAEAFVELTSTDEYPQFMVDYYYASTDTAAEVTSADIAYFESVYVPVLRRLHPEPMSFDEWQAAMEDGTGASDSIPIEAVITLLPQTFELIDLLFAGLGVFSAFGIVTRATKEDLEA